MQVRVRGLQKPRGPQHAQGYPSRNDQCTSQRQGKCQLTLLCNPARIRKSGSSTRGIGHAVIVMSRHVQLLCWGCCYDRRSSLHSSTYSYQTPTGLLESYQTGLGLGQISCWLTTIQILSSSPSGVLVNSYQNDPKSQGIPDS